LYRFHLGWLLDHRFLLLTHRGRKSGRIYHTVLEVVRFDHATSEAVVVSGWGGRADWFRNLRAHPALEIAIGRDRFVPTQRFLDANQVEAELADYARGHPLAVRVLPRLFGVRLDGPEATRRAFAQSVRMVAFCPDRQETDGI
jgi:deazaflavin-dependent oxidoreductase (nitroreductase family)